MKTIRKEYEIDKENKSFIKIIFGNDEKELVQEFINTLKHIRKDSMFPKIYTFSSKNYTTTLLSRMIKYNITENTVPLEKYKIVDLKYLLGNFNDLIPTLNYLEIENRLEPYVFFSSDKFEEKDYLNIFLKYQIKKSYSLSVLTNRLIKSTYTSFINLNDIVVDIETEPLIDKYDEFIKEFPYLLNNTKEKIIEFMKNNPIYSRIISISICKIIENKKEELE